jgi:heme-degrading monooxygenase HmoA
MGAMPSLFLIRALTHPLHDRDIFAFHRRVMGLCAPVAGFQDFTIWRYTNDPDVYLFVGRCRDLAAADEALERLEAEALLHSQQDLFQQAPDVDRINIIGQSGAGFTEVPLGKWLSKSVREAGPGMHDDLLQELEVIFGELESLEGFLGAIRAQNAALDEEVIGIAFWGDLESYKRSLPRVSRHQVRLYQRIM